MPWLSLRTTTSVKFLTSEFSVISLPLVVPGGAAGVSPLACGGVMADNCVVAASSVVLLAVVLSVLALAIMSFIKRSKQAIPKNVTSTTVGAMARGDPKNLANLLLEPVKLSQE